MKNNFLAEKYDDVLQNNEAPSRSLTTTEVLRKYTSEVADLEQEYKDRTGIDDSASARDYAIGVVSDRYGINILGDEGEPAQDVEGVFDTRKDGEKMPIGAGKPQRDLNPDMAGYLSSLKGKI